MTVRSFMHSPSPPSFNSVADVQVWARRQNDGLIKLRKGKTENVLEVTLTANAASTVITDNRLSPQSCLGWDPRTANAAAELGAGTLYVTDANRGKGTITVTHANNAQADRTYFMSITG